MTMQTTIGVEATANRVIEMLNNGKVPWIRPHGLFGDPLKFVSMLIHRIREVTGKTCEVEPVGEGKFLVRYATEEMA